MSLHPADLYPSTEKSKDHNISWSLLVFEHFCCLIKCFRHRRESKAERASPGTCGIHRISDFVWIYFNSKVDQSNLYLQDYLGLHPVQKTLKKMWVNVSRKSIYQKNQNIFYLIFTIATLRHKKYLDPWNINCH